MRTWQKTLILIMAVLVLLIGGIAGWFYWQWQQMNRPVVVDGTETSVELSSPSPGEKANFVLMGVDARPGETASRSDTLIFVSVDTTREKPAILVLSIPRDSKVEIPDYGINKINAAHTWGGVPLVLQTVTQFLGRSIHYYVEIDFEGFAKVMNILGGVDLNVEERMYYPEEGINLQPGLQHLDGEQCLAFVRYRNYPEGDIARVQKQQQFLSAVIDQNFTVANALKLPAIFNAITPYVSTNLPLDKAISFGKTLANMSMNQVQMQMVPGEAQMIDGTSYWIVDEEGLNNILYTWDHPPESSTSTPESGTPTEGSNLEGLSEPSPSTIESQAP